MPICAYVRALGAGAGPSGLADWPRPFVFRATHLDGHTIQAGESFHFDLNLFDVKPDAVAYLALAFAQLAREGLGSGRSRVELTGVSQLDTERHAKQNPHIPRRPRRSNWTWLSTRPRTRAGEFLTPTELKSGQQLAARPEFSILAARIRDRISTLRELYGEGPLDIDFRRIRRARGAGRMTRCEIQQAEVVRRSSRTGQIHPIGGFVGEAEYEGDLTEFMPYVRAARWTGVGRQTVWGNGEIEATNR